MRVLSSTLKMPGQNELGGCTVSAGWWNCILPFTGGPANTALILALLGHARWRSGQSSSVMKTTAMEPSAKASIWGLPAWRPRGDGS